MEVARVHHSTLWYRGVQGEPTSKPKKKKKFDAKSSKVDPASRAARLNLVPESIRSN